MSEKPGLLMITQEEGGEVTTGQLGLRTGGAIEARDFPFGLKCKAGTKERELPISGTPKQLRLSAKLEGEGGTILEQVSFCTRKP